MSTRFEDYCKQKQDFFAKSGVKFNPVDLHESFIPFFNSQERVKIKLSWGGEKFGRIGITTGHKPAFLLMHNSRALGSSEVLSSKDKVIAVKKASKYKEVFFARDNPATFNLT